MGLLNLFCKQFFAVKLRLTQPPKCQDTQPSKRQGHLHVLKSQNNLWDTLCQPAVCWVIISACLWIQTTNQTTNKEMQKQSLDPPLAIRDSNVNNTHQHHTHGPAERIPKTCPTLKPKRCDRSNNNGRFFLGASWSLAGEQTCQRCTSVARNTQ